MATGFLRDHERRMPDFRQAGARWPGSGGFLTNESGVCAPVALPRAWRGACSVELQHASSRPDPDEDPRGLRSTRLSRRAARGRLRVDGGGHRVPGLTVPDSAGERRAGDRERERRQGVRAQAEQRPHLQVRQQAGHRRPHAPRATSARSARSARTSIARCSTSRTRRSSGARATTAPTTWAATSCRARRRARSRAFVVNLRGEPGDEEIVVSRA